MKRQTCKTEKETDKRMKTRFVTLALILTFAGIFIVSGCSDSTVSNQSTDGELNFVDDFGGYQATDEPPAFGDEEISQVFPATEAAESDLNQFPELSAIETDSGILVYSLRITWGMLEYDSTVTSPTDWSGKLEVDTGCIKVVNKVLFEPGQDHFIRPRESCRKLEWVSQTTVHYDGILVFLYFRSADIDPATTEVRFETTPYSRTFTLAELDSLEEIIDIDQLGNQVSIQGYRLERLECEEGYLEGRWIKRGNGRFKGLFFGRFISKDGIFMGHVKGHWGERGEDEQLFFGKWINHYGGFRGFLRGEWGYDETAETYESEGWYSGNYFSRNGINLGTLSGKWVSHHRGSMPNSGATDKVPKHARGYFHGIWKQYCN